MAVEAMIIVASTFRSLGPAAIGIPADDDVVALALTAFDQPRQQELIAMPVIEGRAGAGLAVLDRKSALARFRICPQVIIDDPKMRNIFDDPVPAWIDAGLTLTYRGLLDEALAVPNHSADVEFAIEDATSAPTIAVNGIVVPPPPAGTGDALFIEYLRDGPA